MSYQYTKGTLKTKLQEWNEDNSAEFVAELDEVIKRGEFRLARLLDLEQIDSVVTATTSGTVPEVWKPENLIVDRLLLIDPISTSKKIVFRRSRAWVEMFNVDDEEGVPKYYADYDEERWFMAPIPDDAYLIYVHGLFRPASITDGNDDNTSWFSTRVPDLLYLACSIEACEYLKFWAHKSAAEAELTEKAEKFLGIAAALQRSDVEDLVGNRQNANKPNTQQVTE